MEYEKQLGTRARVFRQAAVYLNLRFMVYIYRIDSKARAFRLLIFYGLDLRKFAEHVPRPMFLWPAHLDPLY